MEHKEMRWKVKKWDGNSRIKMSFSTALSSVRDWLEHTRSITAGTILLASLQQNEKLVHGSESNQLANGPVVKFLQEFHSIASCEYVAVSKETEWAFYFPESKLLLALCSIFLLNRKNKCDKWGKNNLKGVIYLRV